MSGVLVVLLENSTGLVSYLHLFGKEYVGVGELHCGFSEQELLDSIKLLTGKIYQRPPLRSSVSRRIRVREVYYFDLLEIRERRFLFRVSTESGTYIRKLIHDLGLIMGCGAHMVELRRTKDGPFDESRAKSLWDVLIAKKLLDEEHDESYIRKVVLPIEHALVFFPSVYVKDSAVSALCHGAHLAIGGISSFEEPINKDDIVAVKTLKGELIGMGRAIRNFQELRTLKSGWAVKMERVIMRRDLYPKMW